jgi:hypothetical protein
MSLTSYQAAPPRVFEETDIRLAGANLQLLFGKSFDYNDLAKTEESNQL